MIHRYCFNCGTKEEEVPGRGYNTTTGKRNTGVICPNTKCRRHCEGKYGGCDVPTFFGSTCRRCGTKHY